MKKIFALMLTLAMVLSLAACGGSAGTDTTQADGDSAETGAPVAPSNKVAWCGSNLANEFAANMAEYCEQVGAENGWEVTVFNADSDLNTQINQIETAATQGFAAIMLDPVSNTGLDTVLADVVKTCNIPVITIHGSVQNQDMLTAYVAMDMVKGGELEMQGLVDALGGEGKICVITGTEGQTTAMLITEGYYNVLENYPNIEVVYEAAGDWGADSATTFAENWLTARDDIDAIICNNDGMALGVRPVISEMGLTGEVKLFGLDAISEARKYLRNGELDGSILMDTHAEFVEGYKVVAAFYGGEAFDKEVIIDPIFVNADNIDEYFPND